MAARKASRPAEGNEGSPEVLSAQEARVLEAYRKQVPAKRSIAARLGFSKRGNDVVVIREGGQTEKEMRAAANRAYQQRTATLGAIATPAAFLMGRPRLGLALGGLSLAVHPDWLPNIARRFRNTKRAQDQEQAA